MDKRDYDILYVQRMIQPLDATKCKLIASWLSQHIRQLEADEKLYKISIRQLQLSTRALNVLQYHNIVTIGQLLKQSADWDDIRALRGAGEKVVHELQEKVTLIRNGTLNS